MSLLYKYETHAHSSETSNCSRISGAELVRHYHALGYAGICITDHFFNGNMTVPRNLPWKDRVELFVRGYENAKAEGDKLGITVMFGWEYSYQGADFLTYGPDADWLYRNDQIMNLSLGEYLDFVHQEEGFVVHAHPFRTAGYIPMIHLIPHKVDAVEVINSSMSDDVNSKALWYANEYHLKHFAGSDIHWKEREILAGIVTEKPLDNIRDFINTLRLGEYNIFCESHKH